MNPTDPRHGTEAGHEQHLRDGESPCDPCYQAKLIAARRRSKRKAQGLLYTLPAGPAHDRVTRWHQAGASYDDISIHTGLEESVISRLLLGDRNMTVYARTQLAIMRAPSKMPLTTIGAVRRIQALQRLGWSIETIAQHCGVHRDTILDARHGRHYVARRVRVSIAEGYERLHMTIPEGETKQHRAGITRSRNYATRHGWLPPLAWDDIDDGLEKPEGWQYRKPDRRDAVIDFAEQGMNATQTARRLQMTREALEVWCRRHGLAHTYRRMAAREALHENQWTQEESA